MSTIECVRCGRSSEPLTEAPVPGEAGREVLEKICPACWAEWQNAEVMVINELRLNFMDPKSIDILTQHMREFLLLTGSGPNLPPGVPTT